MNGVQVLVIRILQNEQ